MPPAPQTDAPSVPSRCLAARSDIFLKEAVRLMQERGYTIGNIDCTIIAQVGQNMAAGCGGGGVLSACLCGGDV